MITKTELQLRKLALLLTAGALLQVVWMGASLLLLSEPEVIVPAASSLQVDGVKFGSAADDDLPDDLVTRPLFWAGRQMHVESREPVVASPRETAQVSSTLDNAVLLGIYTGGENPGIIVSLNGEKQRLQHNEAIDDWKFTMHSADSVVFENGDHRRVLHLEHALPKFRTVSREMPKAGAKPVDKAKSETKQKKSSGNK